MATNVTSSRGRLWASGLAGLGPRQRVREGHAKRKPFLAVVAVVSLVAQPALAGIPKEKAQYSGGTVAAIPVGAIGPLVTTDAQNLIFRWDGSGKNPAGSWSIPYAEIISLSYGQHAGRRVGAAVAWGATTLGIMALPILFSKKRRHYLTIEYKGAQGRVQAAIFQVGKEAICPTLTVLEVRSGQKVQYENDEARTAGCR